MRFKKAGRYPFNDTARKRAFIPIRKRREREKLPLFAELIGETQTETVDEEMARRARQWAAAEQATRDRLAFNWRRARAMLRAMDTEERAATLHYWNRCSYPAGDPTYLAGLIREVEQGRWVVWDDELVSMNELEHRQERGERIRAMSDEELLRQIQTHFSDMYRDLLRAERRRRQEAALDRTNGGGL